MGQFSQHLMRQSYDMVAEEYAREYYNELKSKPFDQDILKQFANRVLDKGLVCEIGCGPAQICHYLLSQGVSTYGLDLSFKMLNHAKQTDDSIAYVQANMLSLPAQSNSHAGIVSFYSINHVKRDVIVDVLREIYRVLTTSGLLILAAHLGEGDLQTDNWFGKEVHVDTTFFSLAEIVQWAKDAEFIVETAIEREPYPIEWQNQRGYIIARKHLATD